MMLRILLLTLSLVSMTTSLQNFTGVGTVECPIPEDITDGALCEVSFTNNPLSCIFQCPDAASFVVESLSMDASKLYLPCDCTQAINCPDSCTFTAAAPTATNTTTPNIKIQPADYIGPGFLTCDSLPNFLSCNISIIEDCALDPSTCGIQDVSTVLDFISTGQISVPLLCNCVQATDCPCGFTATGTESNSTSFEGAGTVVCPLADFALEPCFPLEIGLDLCDDCQEFDVSPFIFQNQFSEIHIPLPCECLKVAGCPASCRFLDSVGTTRETFTGSGRLTCPIDDYFGSPCIPVGDNCNGSGFSCVIDALSTLNVTNTSIAIDLPCNCLSLPECSAECTFESKPESLTVNATGPGSLICPVIDYAFGPCTLEVTEENCDCEPTDFLRQSIVNFTVSLPCDCAIATNCPRSCEFTTEVVTNGLAQPDFTGPAVVTCPIENYFEAPCQVNFLNIFNCFNEPGDCLSASVNTDDIANITENEVLIALSCSCMQLSECPDSCTIMASSPVESLTTSKAPTPATTTGPASTTTKTPVAQPTPTRVTATPQAPNNQSALTTPTAASNATDSPVQEPSNNAPGSGGTLLLKGTLRTLLVSSLLLLKHL